VEYIRIVEVAGHASHTFHAVEDLPCDLYGGDDCRKTLIEENDILKTNHIVGRAQTTVQENAYRSTASSIRGALNSDTAVSLLVKLDRPEQRGQERTSPS
jgi:hypothetical protein